MPRIPVLLLAAALTVVVAAQSLPEDPVLKARTQRAQSQGIKEGDLPPVPRTVQEPPPLPAPEAHPKDGRRGKAAAKQVATRKGKGTKKASPAKARSKARSPKRTKKR